MKKGRKPKKRQTNRAAKTPDGVAASKETNDTVEYRIGTDFDGDQFVTHYLT